MSEPVDSPADPRPGSATPTGEAADSAAASQGSGPRRNTNRRRGSRGGRGRKKPASQEAAKTSGGATAAVRADGDPMPDLPDRPGENRASPDAAARALIPKPKIGDSRPAPPP